MSKEKAPTNGTGGWGCSPHLFPRGGPKRHGGMDGSARSWPRSSEAVNSGAEECESQPWQAGVKLSSFGGCFEDCRRASLEPLPFRAHTHVQRPAQAQPLGCGGAPAARAYLWGWTTEAEQRESVDSSFFSVPLGRSFCNYWVTETVSPGTSSRCRGTADSQFAAAVGFGKLSRSIVSGSEPAGDKAVQLRE